MDIQDPGWLRQVPLATIHKAKARRKIKRRPEWQDTRPPEAELRASYDIAARHEQRWSSAYLSATRDLLTPAVLADVRRKLQDNDTSGAVNAIPWFKKTDPTAVDAWAGFGKRISRAYVDVITEAGENEFKREKIPLTFEVTKAVKPRVPVVPVNPWSLDWIQTESSALIKEVSQSTKITVRQIILRGHKRGLRTDAMLGQIKERVGLLAREELAVQRRLDGMLVEGVDPAIAKKAAKRYAAQLHTKRAKRIGRSETITAQSKGRRDAWAVARQNDELPADAEREWAAVVLSPRTCPICEGLDGQRVKLGESYYSEVLKRDVEGPGIPAHPQ